MFLPSMKRSFKQEAPWMATASASSGFWAAHVEIERSLKGSKILRLGFLDGTRSESFLPVERVFSRSQFSPSMRRCPKYLGLGTWWVEGHGMFILFPQNFSCPRKPLFLRVVAQKKWFTEWPRQDSYYKTGSPVTTWDAGHISSPRALHGLFSI